MRDVTAMEERLEKETVAKDELQMKFVKAVDESREWKARYDNDIAAKTDEMEDLRYNKRFNIRNRVENILFNE